MTPIPPPSAAVRRLSADLLARRIAAIEPAVRVLIGVMLVVIAGFVFWQVRIPLAAAAHVAGPPAALQRLAQVLACIALAAASVAHGAARNFIASPPGPEWLALPIGAGPLARHALAEARQFAWFAYPPALAALLAGVGLVPPLWLALVAVAFVVAWLEGTQLAHALAWRMAAAAPARARASLVMRVLAAGRTARPRGRPRTAAWNARGPVAAIGALDRARTFAEALSRRAALWAAALTLAGLAAWALPRPAIERAALAFAAHLLAAAALGTWSSSLVAGDPASLWRPLPLAPRRVWAARVQPLVIVALALPIAHAAFAAPLGLPARVGIVLSWPIPTLIITTLGLHHALSLYPDARAASRITATWLGVSVAASLMIPLLGWLVLLVGAVHAARRVARGFRSETR